MGANVSPIEAAVPAQTPPFRVLNGHAYFNGRCEECRPFCAAVCCRGYGFIPLTEEEVRSGSYLYKETSETCGCETCKRMRELGIRYALRKLADGSCIYLDGGRRCSIYDTRPATCRNYSCVHVPFVLKTV
jgi:Fe-S-cluster containining protein